MGSGAKLFFGESGYDREFVTKGGEKGGSDEIKKSTGTND